MKTTTEYLSDQIERGDSVSEPEIAELCRRRGAPPAAVRAYVAIRARLARRDALATVADAAALRQLTIEIDT